MPNPKPTFDKISAMFKEEYGVDPKPPTLKETYLCYRSGPLKILILALIVEVMAAAVLLYNGRLPTGPIIGIIYLTSAVCILLVMKRECKFYGTCDLADPKSHKCTHDEAGRYCGKYQELENTG